MSDESHLQRSAELTNGVYARELVRERARIAFDAGRDLIEELEGRAFDDEGNTLVTAYIIELGEQGGDHGVVFSTDVFDLKDVLEVGQSITQVMVGQDPITYEDGEEDEQMFIRVSDPVKVTEQHVDRSATRYGEEQFPVTGEARLLSEFEQNGTIIGDTDNDGLQVTYINSRVPTSLTGENLVDVELQDIADAEEAVRILVAQAEHNTAMVQALSAVASTIFTAEQVRYEPFDPSAFKAEQLRGLKNLLSK